MNKTLNITKFAAVAIALGFISPTITINDKAATSTVSEVSFSIMNMAEAREVKKRNRSQNKSKNTNRNKNKNKNSNRNVNSNKNTNKNVNVNSNKNTNVNVNSNKNTNVNVNVNNNRRRVNPLGVVAAVVVGTVIVASAMPPNCTTIIVNGRTYRQCGTTYYQASGPDYIIVNSPY